MQVCVQNEDSVCESVSSVARLQRQVLFLLTLVVELSYRVQDSSDLLGLPRQEKVTREQSDKFFKVVLSALFEDQLSIGRKYLP